jgi:phosphate transport system permease protein
MSQAAEAAASVGAYAEPAGHLRWRHLKDGFARRLVGVGGVAVLGSLLLIFVYLLVEVLPLFAPATVDARTPFRIPGDEAPTLHLALEEQSEIGLRVSASSEVTFFDLATGSVREQLRLPVGGRSIAAVVPVASDSEDLAAALSDGSVLLFKHSYAVTYPDDKRFIDPSIEFPQGAAPLPFMNEAPRALIVRKDDEAMLLAGVDAQQRIHLRAVEATTSLLGESTLTVGDERIFEPRVRPDFILVTPLMEWLYVADAKQGRLALYRLRDGRDPDLVAVEDVGAPVTQARFLSGGISVITTSTSGRVTQWFPARRAETTPDGDPIWYLARVREFDAPEGEVTALGAEQRRRGFAVGTASGRVAIYHATAGRELLDIQAFEAPVARLTFDPRANTLLALASDGTLQAFALHNEYPEISWSPL